MVEDSDKGQTVGASDAVALPLKPVNLGHLRRIMALRLEETFELIEADLAKADLLDYVRSGVFICGGGARVPGVQQLAERIFQLPAQLGRTNSISGLKSALDQPEFVTAIGLVKYGSFQQKRRVSGSLTQTLREKFGTLLRRP